MKYLNYSEQQLEQLDGLWTAKEISQQPESWRSVLAGLKNNAQLTGF